MERNGRTLSELGYVTAAMRTNTTEAEHYRWWSRSLRGHEGQRFRVPLSRGGTEVLGSAESKGTGVSGSEESGAEVLGSVESGRDSRIVEVLERLPHRHGAHEEEEEEAAEAEEVGCWDPEDELQEEGVQLGEQELEADHDARSSPRQPGAQPSLAPITRRR